ncbi:RNA polymerase sigma factor [Thalassospira sp. NFXS8]|uniref:RNA polymerase sigma factor n=1 Tax=Thalassospira sp. NFXS8 TaxID=2819093 RepID=UPI0032DEB58A
MQTDRFDPALRDEMSRLLPRILRFARSLTRDAATAEDLVQNAYMKAVESLAQFAPGTRLDSWMFKIVQNTWIDEKRRAQRAGNVISLQDAREAGMPAQGHGGNDRVFLRAALATLPADQRSALTLVLIEGYSYREAAEILKVPDGTVMSRVARARRALVDLHDADHAVPPRDIKRGTP